MLGLSRCATTDGRGALNCSNSRAVSSEGYRSSPFPSSTGRPYDLKTPSCFFTPITLSAETSSLRSSVPEGASRSSMISERGTRFSNVFKWAGVPPPGRPALALRNNPALAIAEPVREALPNHALGVHATVEGVDQLVTNHPTGLRTRRPPRCCRKIRNADGPDVAIALAGNFGSPPRGKLFAMGDPSALMNQMLRYPGNRAFAAGLLRYLADTGGEGNPGRLFIITNRFEESGSYAGANNLPQQ